MADDVSNHSTFDIYSDLLLERQAPGVSVEQLEKTNTENEVKLKELTDQLKNFQTQNAALSEENNILKTNISELFKTAQAELRRKDRQLEELSDRRHGDWRRSHCKGSINDRLRDLQNNPRSYPRRTNGLDYMSNKRDTNRSDRSSEQRSADVRKPPEKECDDKASRSGTGARCDPIRNETFSATEFKQTVCEEEIKDSYGDNRKEKTDSAKSSDNLSVHSNSQSKEIKICNANNERNDSERIPNRQSLKNYRIPKTSRTCGSYNNPLSSREETGRDASPKSVTSNKKIINSKSSGHRSTYSPPGHKRGSDKDDIHCISVHSLKHGRSHERSKSREKSTRVSDRNSNRSSEERYSGRKRRHSSEKRSSPLDSAPQKKYKKDSTAEAHKKDHRDRSSKGSKQRKEDEFGSYRNDGSLDQEKSTEVAHNKRHTSSKTSSHKNKLTDATSIEGHIHTRRRHKSDRKNKSLKRAKELLHKMHSTPKKHKKHKKEESKNHKHKRRHSSKKHRLKDKAEDREGAVEEQRIPGIDFREVNNFHEEERKKPKDTSTVWQEVCTKVTSADLQETTKDATAVCKKLLEQDSESPKQVAMSEIKGKWNNEEKAVTSEPNSNQCGFILGDKILPKFKTENAGLVTADKLEMSPRDENSESLLIGESQTDEMDAENHTEKNGTGGCPGLGNDTKVRAGNTVLQTVKEMPSLRQPDTDSCGYSSEHETILICAPASQYDNSESDSNSQPASKASASPYTPFKHETVQSDVESSVLTLHGQYISYSDDERDMLRIDTSACQSQEQLENVCKPDNKQEVFSVSKTEHEQTESNSIHLTESDSIQQMESNLIQRNESSLIQQTESKQTESVVPQDDQGTNVPNLVLKPVQSPIGNPSNSFSEKIIAVFGSNSFLESDNLESSKDASLIQKTEDVLFHPEDSKLVLGNPSDDSACASEAQKKHSNFAETVLNVFGSNSFLGSDDLDSKQGAEFNVSEMDVEFEGEQNVGSLQSNSTPTTNHQDITEDKQSTSREKTKAGSLTDTVFAIFGSTSLIEDDNHDEGKETSSHPVSDPLTTQSEVPPSSSSIVGTEVEPEKIVSSPSDFVLMHDDKDLPNAEPDELTESAKQLCIPEVVDVADISLNTPSFDDLSYSASPNHDSLFEDSENSCQSSQSKQKGNESRSVQVSSGNSEHDHHSDQDKGSESAGPHEDDTPGGTTNLSDGEIVSSSDSEIAPNYQTSTRKSDRKDSNSKPKKSKSSKPRSRSRDRKRSRSRDKKRPRSGDKQMSGGKDRAKQSRNRYGEHRDRDEFFKEKMRILKERQAAKEARVRNLSNAGCKPNRDRSHDSRSVRLEVRDRRSYKDEKNIHSTEENKERHRTKTDERGRGRRQSGEAGASSRQSSKAHGARRHDTDKRRTVKNSEREKLTRDEKERDKRRSYKR